MLLYSWISFWSTYLIFGCLLYNDDRSRAKNIITTKELLNRIGLNAALTLILTPITNYIPELIYVPNTWYGYIIRLVLGLIIGDLCFYWTHRMFHSYWFYDFHKLHHSYIIPHSMAGLYCHPVEMVISNHLSMIIPLKIISCYSNTMMMLESAAVAYSILNSHSGKDNNITGSISHNKHHKYKNCNYGFLYLTDYIFDTSG